MKKTYGSFLEKKTSGSRRRSRFLGQDGFGGYLSYLRNDNNKQQLTATNHNTIDELLTGYHTTKWIPKSFLKQGKFRHFPSLPWEPVSEHFSPIKNPAKKTLKNTLRGGKNNLWIQIVGVHGWSTYPP